MKRRWVLTSVTAALLIVSGCGPTYDATGEMVDELRRLLPVGSVTEATAHKATESAESAELVFDDGRGESKIVLTIVRWGLPVPSWASDCPDSSSYPTSTCTTHAQPDGSHIQEIVLPADANKPAGAVKTWTTRLTMQDGSQVVALEINAPSRSAVTPTRSTPPLSQDQLRSLTTAQVWQSFLDALTAPPGGAAPTPTPRTAARITNILTALLPTGLEVADTGGSDEFGHLTVDNGLGKSLVAVNVQMVKPENHKAMKEIFAGGRTLRDDTLLATRREHPAEGGPDTIQWTADTLRLDGLRVVVSSLNARAYHLPAGRRDPGLTLSQLEQIALDPHWLALRS